MRVGREEIAAVVAARCGIPVGTLTADEGERLKQLEELLSGRVKGQPEAIAAVADAVRLARAGLKKPERPAGVFLFVDLMGGHMLIASGGGSMIRSKDSVLKKGRFANGARFPGTLVAISFRRSEAADFDSKLHQVKELEIPLRASVNPATFQP